MVKKYIRIGIVILVSLLAISRLLRLTAPNGIIDIRNSRVYSEVETTVEYLKYFRANSTA